jgi:hypothetical protein
MHTNDMASQSQVTPTTANPNAAATKTRAVYAVPRLERHGQWSAMTLLVSVCVGDGCDD